MNGDPHAASGPTPGGPASPPPRSKVPYIIAAVVALGLLNYALQSGPGPSFGGGGGGGGGADLVEKPAPEKAADDEVARLKREVETLKKNQKQPAPGADEEKAAAALLQKLTQAVTANQIDTAKGMLSVLKASYPTTSAYKRARKFEGELAVIGKDAPTYLNVERWLANPASIDLTSTSPTLLVFWEEWCPHCRREVPEIQDVYQRFGRRGLQVVGLTKISKSSTPEKVDDFIRKNRLQYPIAKEKMDGTKGILSSYFNVRGIPAAAVVKGGKIVWRGHPGRLTEDMIKGWL